MNEMTVSELVDRFSEQLELRWISGRRHADKRTLSVASFRARPSLVGYLNLIHPNRIQPR